MLARIIINGPCINKYNENSRTNSTIENDICNENNNCYYKNINNINNILLVCITSSMITHNGITKKYVIEESNYVYSIYSDSHAKSTYVITYRQTSLRFHTRSVSMNFYILGAFHMLVYCVNEF